MLQRKKMPRIDILTDEFRRFEMEISETHIPAVGSIKLGDLEDRE